MKRELPIDYWISLDEYSQGPTRKGVIPLLEYVLPQLANHLNCARAFHTTLTEWREFAHAPMPKQLLMYFGGYRDSMAKGLSIRGFFNCVRFAREEEEEMIDLIEDNLCGIERKIEALERAMEDFHAAGGVSNTGSTDVN